MTTASWASREGGAAASFPLGYESFEHCSWRCSPVPGSLTEMDVCLFPTGSCPGSSLGIAWGFREDVWVCAITAKRECSFVSPYSEPPDRAEEGRTIEQRLRSIAVRGGWASAYPASIGQ